MEFLKTLKLGDLFEVQFLLEHGITYPDKRLVWRKAIFLACWNDFVQFAFLKNDYFLNPVIMSVNSENVSILGTHCKD